MTNSHNWDDVEIHVYIDLPLYTSTKCFVISAMRSDESNHHYPNHTQMRMDIFSFAYFLYIQCVIYISAYRYKNRTLSVDKSDIKIKYHVIFLIIYTHSNAPSIHREKATYFLHIYCYLLYIMWFHLYEDKYIYINIFIF